MTRTAWIVFTLTVAALTAGCGSIGASPTPTVAAPTRTPSKATPSATAVATPTDSATSPSPTPTSGSTGPSSQPGPPTTYLGDETSEIAGQLRTFCWHDTCADAFELPPKQDLTILVVTDPAAGLTFRAEMPFNRWAASYSSRTMEDLEPLGQGGAVYDPDTSATVPATITEANMTAPPSGDWIVYIVMNSFENEAHYVWRVQVP
ncbi:MAG TPA: hypothetical protein VEX62_06785 [Candidatus Limnocylindrales bacterium]|nr:hypothetical protein [Candidatus Limnocylindrales bacterium]